MKTVKNKFNLIGFCIAAVLSAILTVENSSLKIIPILYCYFIAFKHILPLYLKNYKRYWAINILLLYGIFLILRCMFFDANDGVLGIWQMSMIGNLQVGALVIFLPLLTVVPSYPDFFNFFIRLNKYLIYIYILLFVLFILDIENMCTNAILASSVCLAILYYLKINRLLIIFTVSLILARDLITDERAMFISLFLTMAASIIYSHLKILDKLPLKLFMYIGAGFTIWLLMFNLYYQEDFFSWLADNYGNNQMIGDNTRSFLFIELINDFNQTHAWILGKGMLGTYFSPEMLRASKAGTTADSINRLITECGWLLLIFKGGLIQAVLYGASQIFIMRKALKQELHIYKIFVIILLVHFILMFVSFSIYFDLQNIFYWLVAGCCLVLPENFKVVNVHKNKKYDNLNNYSNI